MQYKNPKPTVDVIVTTKEGLVLVLRKNPPPGWALPGGFIEEGETAEAAAVREVEEETGLQVTLHGLLGVYSDPARDPRHHTLTIVYFGSAEGVPHGADDAADAHCFELDVLPSPLAFDHDQILEDYRVFLQTGQIPHPGR